MAGNGCPERSAVHAQPLGARTFAASSAPQDVARSTDARPPSDRERHARFLPLARALCCDSVRGCESFLCPLQELVRLVQESLRHWPKGEVDASTLLYVAQRWRCRGLAKEGAIVI